MYIWANDYFMIHVVTIVLICAGEGWGHPERVRRISGDSGYHHVGNGLFPARRAAVGQQQYYTHHTATTLCLTPHSYRLMPDTSWMLFLQTHHPNRLMKQKPINAD